VNVNKETAATTAYTAAAAAAAEEITTQIRHGGSSYGRYWVIK